MKVDYQVTLICATGRFKPVSSIVHFTQENDNDLSAEAAAKKRIRSEGIQKICNARRWSANDLKAYDYTRIKVRKYDKEKIEAENKARYEAIKEAKYASGEWQRPKFEAKV